MQWAHFDPPWAEREHHDPAGMIALCAEHHAKVDAGALTRDQLRAIKADPPALEVHGRFEWLRRRLLCAVGGNLFLETRAVLRVNGRDIVWFTRDDDEHVLLNINMLTTSPDERASMEDSFWILKGLPSDLESPPSGRTLRLEYTNGDRLSVEFREVADADEITRRYPYTRLLPTPGIVGLLSFPVTLAEIQMTVGGTEISLDADSTTIRGMFLAGNFVRNADVMIEMHDDRFPASSY